MQFSREETRDIALAIVSLGAVLAINPLPRLGINFDVIPGYFIGLSLGFILHELSHKAMANRLGAEAFFKLWPQGIFIGLLVALISPFKMLAPGAVVVYSHKFARWKQRADRYMVTAHGPALSRGEMGLISAVGPAANIVLSFIFLSIPGTIFRQIAYTNSILATFNLLPVPPLDGSKIMLWNAVAWLFLLILAVTQLLLSLQLF